jgi:hypothetical protein
MADGWTDRTALAAPRSIDERYAGRSIEHRTSTIVEVWCKNRCASSSGLRGLRSGESVGGVGVPVLKALLGASLPAPH